MLPVYPLESRETSCNMIHILANWQLVKVFSFSNNFKHSITIYNLTMRFFSSRLLNYKAKKKHRQDGEIELGRIDGRSQLLINN